MTTPSAGQVADRLTAYADSIRTAGAIHTYAVHAAFATVPRHRFLPHFRYRADEYVLDTSDEPPNEVLDIVYTGIDFQEVLPGWSRTCRGSGALVVDLGEVLVEFGVAELVDRSCLAQNLALVGVFKQPDEVDSTSSGDHEDELGQSDHTHRTVYQHVREPERESDQDPDREPAREPEREAAHEAPYEPSP